jgi:hypothetical protein
MAPATIRPTATAKVIFVIASSPSQQMSQRLERRHFLPFEQKPDQAWREALTGRRHAFGHGFHNSNFSPIFSYLDSLYQAVPARRLVSLRAKEK